MLEGVPGSLETTFHTELLWPSGTDRNATIREALSGLPGRPDAVGHRVVHGGSVHQPLVPIDADIERLIEKFVPHAPLHNPAALAGIRAGRELYPDAPAFAAFDTAFHSDRPAASMQYGLPSALMESLDIRRYGFHGTAHAALVQATANLEGIPVDQVSAVTLQLGAGCSACAVESGRSVETSMGYTPLEGIVMLTRCGDIDPAIVVELIRNGDPPDKVEALLSRQSGLLGLSGKDDMRDILAAEEQGDERARLALEVFVHRIVMIVGAYFTLLQGRGALVFGGGIGTHSQAIRRRVAAGLKAWNLEIEGKLNASVSEGRISTQASRPVYVFTTREEEYIAEQVARVLRHTP